MGPKTPGVALPNGGKPVAPLAPVAAAPLPLAAPAMTPAAPCAAGASCAQPFATPANRQAPAPVPAPAPPARGVPAAAQTPAIPDERSTCGSNGAANTAAEQTDATTGTHSSSTTDQRMNLMLLIASFVSKCDMNIQNGSE